MISRREVYGGMTMVKLSDNLFCYLSSICRIILNKNKLERRYGNGHRSSLGHATTMIICRTLLYAYASHLRIGIENAHSMTEEVSR